MAMEEVDRWRGRGFTSHAGQALERDCIGQGEMESNNEGSRGLLWNAVLVGKVVP